MQRLVEFIPDGGKATCLKLAFSLVDGLLENLGTANFYPSLNNFPADSILGEVVVQFGFELLCLKRGWILSHGACHSLDCIVDVIPLAVVNE